MTSNPARPTTSPPPALTSCPRCTRPQPTACRPLTDKGYAGAGIGILVPTKGHQLCADNRTRNQLISALRAPAERANALLKSTWKALRRVTLDPWRIGAVTAAALVLLTMQKGTR